MNSTDQIAKKEILHNPVSKSNDELTGRVIGLAMKVHRTLGPGFLESVYQKALLYELAKTGFKAESNRLIQVHYDGVEHEVQLVNYLTATGKDVGLPINFGSRSLEFKKKFRTAKIEDISSTNPVKFC
jgi:hypothetical protein